MAIIVLTEHFVAFHRNVSVIPQSLGVRNHSNNGAEVLSVKAEQFSLSSLISGDPRNPLRGTESEARLNYFTE